MTNSLVECAGHERQLEGAAAFGLPLDVIFCQLSSELEGMLDGVRTQFDLVLGEVPRPLAGRKSGQVYGER